MGRQESREAARSFFSLRPSHSTPRLYSSYSSMPSLRSNPLATLARTVVQSRSAAAPSFRRSTPTSLSSFNSQRSAPFARSYSTAKEEKAETVEGEVVNPEAEAKAEELMKELEEKNKLIAELRVRPSLPPRSSH